MTIRWQITRTTSPVTTTAGLGSVRVEYRATHPSGDMYGSEVRLAARALRRFMRDDTDPEPIVISPVYASRSDGRRSDMVDHVVAYREPAPILAPIYHQDGTRDERFTVAREDGGQYVARFEGLWVALADTESDAWSLARASIYCRAAR